MLLSIVKKKKTNQIPTAPLITGSKKGMHISSTALSMGIALPRHSCISLSLNSMSRKWPHSLYLASDRTSRMMYAILICISATWNKGEGSILIWQMPGPPLTATQVSTHIKHVRGFQFSIRQYRRVDIELSIIALPFN